MLETLYRSAAVALLVAFAATVPAAADTGGPFASTVVDGANTAIKNAMDAKKQPDPKKALPDGSVAQVPPVNQQPVGGSNAQGLPTGLTYFADISIAKPYGNIGNKTNFLPGGMDASIAYGFTPTDRVVASFYQLQHYPVGFNSGTVPTYLPPGFPPTPGINPTPTTLNDQIDVSTKDSFLLLSYEKLLVLTKIQGRPIPLVITPTYVSRWAYIAQSGHGNDIVGFIGRDGQAYTNLNTRTAQYDSVAFTLPFLKTPKMFGTFTVAPTWLTQLNGLNQQNHAQLYQILYLEYNYNKNTRFFLEPESSRDYLPTDPYAQHLSAYFLGVTQRVGGQGFVQLVLNSGSPTNYSPYGVGYFQCSALPCTAGNNTLPYVGGLKATQLQLQFGIGSPVVLPF